MDILLVSGAVQRVRGHRYYGFLQKYDDNSYFIVMFAAMTRLYTRACFCYLRVFVHFPPHLHFIIWYQPMLSVTPPPLPSVPLLRGLWAEDRLLHQLPRRLSLPLPGLPDFFPRVSQALPGRHQPGAAVHLRHRAHRDLQRRLQLHLGERAHQGAFSLQVAGRWRNSHALCPEVCVQHLQSCTTFNSVLTHTHITHRHRLWSP